MEIREIRMNWGTYTRTKATRLLSLYGVFVCALLVAGGVQAQAPASDDFNACSLGANWVVEDPIGDGTVTLTGVGTANAYLELSVPAGTRHDPYGTNEALRVVQSVADADFQVEARFDSAVDSSFQMQGIVVQQDANDFLRFDVYHNGSDTKLFAATFVNGSANILGNISIADGAPIYLSVTRTGDVWSLQYSYDGAAWGELANFNHVMTVNQVGPFAGNSGANPAFTAQVDYFFNTATPIVPEDGGTPGTPATLTTNVVGQGSIQIDPNQTTFYCGELITVTAIADPGNTFSGWSGDLTGTEVSQQLLMSADGVITATFVPDGTALAITNVVATPGINDVAITWDTNEAANSVVTYGLTPSLELGSVSDPTLVTAHSIQLTGLLPNTQYFFEVYSEEPSTDSDTVTGLSFTTLPEPVAGFVSDSFNACSLDGGVWTLIDPVGDVTIDITGVGSNDAQLTFAIPAGTSHDIWTNGSFAPRAMQSVTDADFDIEVKFDSMVSGRYAMQGILVEQDADNFIRFDFYSTDTQTKIFAATFSSGNVSIEQNVEIAGGAPIWMGVTREGDQWTQWFSYNGIDWTASTSFTHVMTVTSVGPFIGNAGNDAPAFTGQVDYFFDTANPVSPEDGPPGYAPTTLTTTVNGNGSIVSDPNQSSFYCSELITVTAVPDPGYLFQGWGGDLTGSQAEQPLDMSVSRTIDATFVVDSTPLAISNIQIEAGDTQAIVSWTTSKPATSAVAYGTTNAYELGTIADGAFSVNHMIELPNLSPETLYHLQITSVDGLGDSESSGDLTLTTTVLGGFASDDFNSFNLNPVWTFVNPVGDATLAFTGTNTADAHMQVQLPAGSSHDIWRDGNFSGRIMQPSSDVDFTLEVKFESLITSEYQMQGVVVEQDADNYIRFDFYHNGNDCKIFAAVLSGGNASVEINATIPCGFPWYMRVLRVGDVFQQQYSFDGASWITATTFSYPMVVNSVGPFFANAGVNPPAFTGIIDYFFNNVNPIVPEDGTVVVDNFPPNVSNLQHSAGENNIVLSWDTDEPASVIVEYGLTPSYELGTVTDTAFLINHLQQITGLQPATDYYVRINCEDASGNVAQTDLVIPTGAVGTTTGPIVDVWYGDIQEFGLVGLPQPWINILGNVSDTEGVASISYSLNGGLENSLNIGPDNRRLFAAGDFNVDLHIDDLDPGENQLVITAVDNIGNATIKIVTVINSAGATWPLPDTTDWSTMSSLTDRSQVIDGKWSLVQGGIRTLELGYDRLVGLGDTNWTDYEVEVPVTVHFVDEANAYTPQSGGPAVGMIMRWPGHSVGAGQQPYHNFYPLGSICWFRWSQTNPSRYQILGNNGANLDSDTSNPLVVGVEYIFKTRVESIGSTDNYRMKVWRSGDPEPAEWQLNGQQSDPGDPANGCFVLLAHHVDATFGNVTVTPGPFPDTPPLTLSNPQFGAGDDFAIITWDTNYPADSRVDYGLTTAYEVGNEFDATQVTSHTITLTNLEPETTYHYQITSFAGNFETVQLGELTFTTASPGGSTNGGGSDIESDDFSAPSLGSQWTFVDPEGDSSFALVGSGTADAHIEISVPAGNPHDVWSSGNQAARLMQPVSDTDFSATVRFDSEVVDRYQLQGILVEQNEANFIRFDTVSVSSGVRIFAASFLNGSPTVRINDAITLGPTTFLRVQRAGDTWTLSWSSDGVNFNVAGSFTQPLTLTQIGPFAGNAGGGTSPAFTARVDYFFNDDSPVTPEDGS